MEFGNRKSLVKFRKALIATTFLMIMIVSAFRIFIKPGEKAFAGNSSYLVLDADTLTPLLYENKDARLPMASTTKIMTALIVLENCNASETVTITKEMTGIEGSSVYLRPEEQLTVSDLLYCLMLRSGNDSAIALACHVAGSPESFAKMMNERAFSMGLNNSHFTNPHGLHNDEHYTSAYDLSVISATAMRIPLFKKIVSTKSVLVGEGESRRKLLNKNKMLTLYPDAVGIKTGYTKKAGRCLVSAAERHGKQLICVVLNCGDTYGTSISLFNRAFDCVL